MPSKSLQPARIAFDAGGPPYSEDFADVYHSADGGPAQAHAVFLGGCGLPQRWRGRARFTILETGFGLGLNFLCCACALLADPQAPSRLHYVAVEKHPPRVEDLLATHARWPEFASLAHELRRRWPPPLTGFHRIDLASGRIALTLLFGDAAQMLAELDAHADAVFLDGFAPAKNPAMWSEAVFREVGRLSVPGAAAATWSVAGQVRGGLERAGFRVEKQAGFGRKREMLTAVRAAAGPAVHSVEASSRHAIIIGAGLGGSWTAHALARRGWNVELIERHGEPGQEASGNPVGVVRPALNLADNENARLARAAFLRTADILAHDAAWEGLYARTGVLHVATTAQQAERMRAITEAHDFPGSFLRWAEEDEAGRLAGRRVAGPGWWIAGGGWARPQALCRALLAHAADRVHARFGTTAGAISASLSGFRVLDARGKMLAEAPVMIVANGLAARVLGLRAMPRLIGVRGQVSFVPAAASRRLDIVVGGDGYIAPMPECGHCIGATFEPGAETIEVHRDDHARNLARAERMVPGFADALDAARLEGWAGLRAATADRLPACGRLSTEGPVGPVTDSGVYLVTGLGARGLIWAPLCAEVLASRLDGEPNPVERSLVNAMDPLREVRTSHRG